MINTNFFNLGALLPAFSILIGLFLMFESQIRKLYSYTLNRLGDLKRRSEKDYNKILFSQKANQCNAPNEPELYGKNLQFDFSKFDGRQTIGYEPYFFELKWDGIFVKQMRLYNDHPSIWGLALVKNKFEIYEVTDDLGLDFTNRCVEPHQGQIFIVRNMKGYNMAIKLIRVEIEDRGDSRDCVTFDYLILKDRSCDFSKKFKKIVEEKYVLE